MAEKAAAPAVAVSPPIPYSRLTQIATEACSSTLASAQSYEHANTERWNTSIINTILRSLISEASHPPTNTPSYKFAVNSTIIQHLTSPTQGQGTGAPTFTKPSTLVGANEASADDEAHPVAGGAGDERIGSTSGAAKAPVGRRGMHSATGAYWNNEKDGMWNFKFEGGEEKGLDVVVSVLWIAL
ncbi:MAG: hypothetical protein M1833_004843 [Piccolia ochrophora]|nr:MAG: hypothetical protein M1833_004843 [Piccolia ochrophora]